MNSSLTNSITNMNPFFLYICKMKLDRILMNPSNVDSLPVLRKIYDTHKLRIYIQMIWLFLFGKWTMFTHVVWFSQFFFFFFVVILHFSLWKESVEIWIRRLSSGIHFINFSKVSLLGGLRKKLKKVLIIVTTWNKTLLFCSKREVGNWINSTLLGKN